MSRADLRRGDQTGSYCTEYVACCKQQQIKNRPVRSDSLWLMLFHLWRMGHQMRAFHDVSRPGLSSSLCPTPFPCSTAKCSPHILSLRVDRCPYTRSLCRAASSQASERGLGHRLKKQRVNEDVKGERGLSISLSSLTWLWSVLRD